MVDVEILIELLLIQLNNITVHEQKCTFTLSEGK